MARNIARLAAVALPKLNKPGMYADGGGLYLQVTASGAKTWIYRFMLNGKAREMGLGPLHTVSLAEAREKARECRKLRLEGIDPIEARKAKRATQRLAAATAMTFQECAERYIEAHKSGWRNAKHATQWPITLKTYAYPILGSLPVHAADLMLVMKVLEPIWHTKPETASRLRGRIEAVLDWATVRGYRHGENPARWRGHLDKLLPARSKVRKIEHHPAVPHEQIGALVAEIREIDGIAARALEFLILTAARTSEVIGARWSEVDLAERIWTVPAQRIKASKEHRVPLSYRTLEILDAMPFGNRNEGTFIFPGRYQRKPLSETTMVKLLHRMGRSDLTVHGFRSTFRDWAAECTNFSREVAEMALAHTVGDKVEAAYRRGDLFNKRRQMMEAWAKHCEPRGANVVAFAANSRSLEPV